MLFKRRHKPSFSRRTKEIVNPEKGYKRAWHYLVWRIKRRPGTPEFIARGFAIGVAVNFWPLLFTHFATGLLFCWIFSGDLLAMFIGTMIGNPWTFAIIYPIMYKIGKALLGLRPTHAEASIDSVEEIWSKIWPIESWNSFSHALYELIIPLIIGGFLLALPCTIASYYLARNMVRVYHIQRRKHILRQFDHVEAEIEKDNSHL